MTAKQKMSKFAVFVFLLAMLVIRLWIPDSQSAWIEIINYLGVCVAGADLYLKCYTTADKFKIVTGIAVIILLALVCGAALIITNIWQLNSRQNDVLTITALILSLPSDLYAFGIKKFVDSEEEIF